MLPDERTLQEATGTLEAGQVWLSPWRRKPFEITRVYSSFGGNGLRTGPLVIELTPVGRGRLREMDAGLFILRGWTSATDREINVRKLLAARSRRQADRALGRR